MKAPSECIRTTREPPWSIEAYQFSKSTGVSWQRDWPSSYCSKNLVMFLSLLVAWLIPDVPKPIVEQLKREKTLLVDVFLREEKEKYQLIHSLFATGPPGPPGLLPLAPPGAALSPLHHRPPAGPQEPGGRYSTLPSATQARDAGREPQPRARCRASSFSQFGRQTATPAAAAAAAGVTSKHTAV
ncbi:unnamed protein product [Arctogadus glacialis]